MKYPLLVTATLVFHSQILLASQPTTPKDCQPTNLDKANQLVIDAERKANTIETPGEDSDLWEKGYSKVKAGDKVGTVFQKVGGPSDIIPAGDKFVISSDPDRDTFSIACNAVDGTLAPKDGTWVYQDDSVNFAVRINFEKGQVKSVEREERPGMARPGFIDIPGEKIERWSKNWRQLAEGDDYEKVMKKMGGPSEPGFPKFTMKNKKAKPSDASWDYIDTEGKINFAIRIIWKDGKVSEVQYREAPATPVKPAKKEPETPRKLAPGEHPTGLLPSDPNRLKRMPKVVMPEEK